MPPLHHRAQFSVRKFQCVAEQYIARLASADQLAKLVRYTPWKTRSLEGTIPPERQTPPRDFGRSYR
jgi:hypothetical protein